MHLRKQPTFCDNSTGFPAKWRLRNKRRNSILKTWVVLWLANANIPRGIASQKHFPDLGGNASSQWNFYARFSDVISRETNGGVAKCLLFSQVGFTFCSEGELVEYWVRHFFSDFESKQLRFASQVSVFFPLRSVISFLFRGFWNNQLPRDGDSFCRGVTRTFSAVCTTHHMPLFPLCPPSPPPAVFPHPPTNVPKRKVSVSLSVYDVSKWSEKFFVAFLSLLLRHANHFNNARLRLQTHRDAWIQKIKKFPVWSSLWRF